MKNEWVESVERKEGFNAGIDTSLEIAKRVAVSDEDFSYFIPMDDDWPAFSPCPTVPVPE